MVGGQRALRETLTGEDHETDLVVGTRDDEVRRYLLSRLQTVRFEVLRQHRTRYIQRHHDVDTFGRFR